MQIIGDHFRRYAHALRFAIGLHGAYKFHPIVKNKHYHISNGARASLAGLQTEYHANVSLRLRRSNRVFLQLQFEAFYTVNLLNAKWKVVPARNSFNYI